MSNEIESIDTPEFQRLLGSYVDGVAGQWELIVHINAWAARRAASGARDGIPAHLREFVEAIAHNYTVYDSGHDETSCRGCSALVSDGDGSVAHQTGCIVPRAQVTLAAAPLADEQAGRDGK